MPDLSNILDDGKRFVVERAKLGEDQLRLLGKISWLKADEKVKGVGYLIDRGDIYVTFKDNLSVKDFEEILDKYDIPKEYEKTHKLPQHAILNLWGWDGLRISFSPVNFLPE